MQWVYGCYYEAAAVLCICGGKVGFSTDPQNVPGGDPNLVVGSRVFKAGKPLAIRGAVMSNPSSPGMTNEHWNHEREANAAEKIRQTQSSEEERTQLVAAATEERRSLQEDHINKQRKMQEDQTNEWQKMQEQHAGVLASLCFTL